MLLVVAVRFLPMRKVNWLNNSIPQAGGYAYAVELDFAAVDAYCVACDTGCCYCAGDWCFVGIPAEALDLNYSIYLHSWLICAVAGSVIIIFLTSGTCYPPAFRFPGRANISTSLAVDSAGGFAMV